MNKARKKYAFVYIPYKIIPYTKIAKQKSPVVVKVKADKEVSNLGRDGVMCYDMSRRFSFCNLAG